MVVPLLREDYYSLYLPRKLCSYHDKVSHHWPEFAQGGKGDVTLADVLRHEAGLPVLSQSIDIEDCWTENINNNRVGKIIEKETRKFADPSQRLNSSMSYLYNLYNLLNTGESTMPSPEASLYKNCSEESSLLTAVLEPS